MGAERRATSEFKAKCLALLDEVAETREPLVVTKRGKAVARVVPAEEPPSLRGTVEFLISDDELVKHEPRISVAAVIREAIDVALPVDLASKRAAYEALMAEEPIPVPESVGYLKAELDEIRGRGV
jgi:prevent-host-death family protein